MIERIERIEGKQQNRTLLTALSGTCASLLLRARTSLFRFGNQPPSTAAALRSEPLRTPALYTEPPRESSRRACIIPFPHPAPSPAAPPARPLPFLVPHRNELASLTLANSSPNVPSPVLLLLPQAGLRLSRRAGRPINSMPNRGV